MNEQSFEQRVTGLERKWTTVTNEWARVSIRIGLTQEDPPTPCATSPTTASQPCC